MKILNTVLKRKACTTAAVAAAICFTGCAADSSDTRSMSSIETPNKTTVSQENTRAHFERAFPTGDRNTSTLLLEQTGPKQVRVGRTVSYEMKVTNLTDQPVRNVMLTSTNPDGFQTTAVSGSTTQPADGGHLGYNVGDLGPKESKTIQVNGMGTHPGMVDTCYMAKCDPPTMCTMLEVTSPSLTLAVQAPADSDICKAVDYQYTITNTGSGVARAVMLHEELPEGLMTTDGQKVVDTSVGDIPEKQSRQVMAHLKASKTGTFKGQAMASTEGESSQAQSTLTAIHAPSLTVELKGSNQDYVGKQVAYKVTVTNKGDAAAQNATLQLTRSGVGALSAAGVDSSGNVMLGTLAPGASKTIDAIASSDQGGTTGVTANASADCAAAVRQSAETKFMTIPALLLETVDESDPIRVGENVVYDVKITNQGTGPDSNVRLTAIVPDGETFVSATGSTEGSANGTTITFNPMATLQPKESATWKITVKANKAADVSFRTSVTSDGVKTPAEKTEPTKLY